MVAAGLRSDARRGVPGAGTSKPSPPSPAGSPSVRTTASTAASSETVQTAWTAPPETVDTIAAAPIRTSATGRTSTATAPIAIAFMTYAAPAMASLVHVRCCSTGCSRVSTLYRCSLGPPALARRGLAVQPLVEPRDRHPQQGASQRVWHPVEGPLVGDEACHAHLVASFTHRTTDRLRTSRSIRSSATSARNRSSSSTSPSPSP